MTDLAKMISEKTGIPENLAEEAVTLVLAEVKKQLPEPLASQLDGIIAGEVDAQSLLSSMGGSNKAGGFLSSLFGKK